MNDSALSGPSLRVAFGWLLAIVVVAGAALRIHFLDSALWYDELVTLVDSARRPFAALVTQFPSNNNHVFYSLLARGSILIFGEHPWSLRLPAVVFGIGSLPLLYLLGAKVTSRFEALAAATLLAFSYHHIWFSQNARGYTILLFCALLSTYLLVAGLREDRRSAYVQFGIVAALSAYTHLTMVLFVVGQAIVVAGHLLASGGWKSWRAWWNPALGFATAGIGTLALYAPMLLEIRTFFGKESLTAAVATTGWAVAETLRGLQLGYATVGAVAVGGALIVVGGLSYLRRDRLVLALFVVPGAVLLAAVVLLQRPTFPRFFFFLAGFVLLILVRGTVVAGGWIMERLPGRASRRSRAMPVLLVAAMTFVSILALPAAYRYPKQDYEQALRFVEAQATAQEAIVVMGGGTEVPYRDYYRKTWPRLASTADLEELRAQRAGVWVLHTFRRYLEALEPGLLAAVETQCRATQRFRGSVADGDIVVSRCEPRR